MNKAPAIMLYVNDWLRELLIIMTGNTNIYIWDEML